MPASAPTSASVRMAAWPDPGCVLAHGVEWSVVHVRPRQEKSLLRDLARIRVPGCLFLEHRVRRYSGHGPQPVELPLIPGYLFVHGSPEQLPLLYRTERIVRILPVPDQPRFAMELADLVALTRAPERPVLVNPEFQPGDRVLVTVGTLAGCRGIIRRRQGMAELVVNITMMGTQVAVRLAAADVEAVEPLERSGEPCASGNSFHAPTPAPAAATA
jgi:transcription antitermination factor NusG